MSDSVIKEWVALKVENERELEEFEMFSDRQAAVRFANMVAYNDSDPSYIGTNLPHFIDLHNEHDRFAHNDDETIVCEVFQIPEAVRNYPAAKFLLVHLVNYKVLAMMPFETRNTAAGVANTIIKAAHETAVESGTYNGEDYDYSLIDVANMRDNEAHDWAIHQWVKIIDLSDYE